MALPTKLVALIGSGAVAASAAAYLAIGASGSGAAGDGSSGAEAADTSAAAQDDERLRPCVAPNGILYASTKSGPCLPGHRRLELEDDEEDGTCELCDPYEDQEGQEKASELEARIDALEKTPYFEVVDENDRVIFRVGPEGARLFDARSNPVADLGASSSGGWLTLRSGDADLSLAATVDGSGIRIREAGVERMAAGSVNGGPYGFGVSSPTSLIAGIGQSRAGSGAVVVGTPTQLKATLTMNDGRGMVSVFNQSEKDGAALTEARIGGGLLDLGMADGNAAVRMGHNGNRYGLVLAGPVLGLPLIPRSALPGSYFMGCASGERPACVPSIAAGN